MNEAQAPPLSHHSFWHMLSPFGPLVYINYFILQIKKKPIWKTYLLGWYKSSLSLHSFSAHNVMDTGRNTGEEQKQTQFPPC